MFHSYECNLKVPHAKFRFRLLSFDYFILIAYLLLLTHCSYYKIKIIKLLILKCKSQTYSILQQVPNYSFLHDNVKN